MNVLVGIPVKAFATAKERLAPALDPAARGRLGRALAARTATIASETGADVRIVTEDAEVSRWAETLGLRVISGHPPTDLNGAAAAVTDATDGSWAVLHADLPFLEAADLELALSNEGPVIAPAHDGGTNLLKSTGPFPFAYGPGSSSRHLAAVPSATVVATLGLAFDLDTTRDLAIARQLDREHWLDAVLAGEPIGVR